MTARRGWVLVTGASRGIGGATAMALAGRGFDLVLWARSADALADTAEQARALGARVKTATVDVGDAGQVASAAESIDGAEGLAGLVLNAGRGVWSPLADVDPEDWSATIRTNLDGTYHVLRETLPHLIAHGHGLLVGMLSDSVLHPFAERAAYSASKSGMSALLEVVRREVRASGVRVSAVLPSRVDTYFQGSQAEAGPGTREGALTAAEVAEVVAGLFELPPNVEIRQVQLAAMTSTYGLFPERVVL
uniref:Short-chain dehydrogenase n=1 Tax=Streptomyces citricolor TaxID=212427 RepID=A0A1B4ZC96_9ACTN|nr:short-chain dehydrogenase [Streptomyces citricolor]BAV57059.1 short-chain dehydrogenase [Streptomyces citricolor]